MHAYFVWGKERKTHYTTANDITGVTGPNDATVEKTLKQGGMKDMNTDTNTGREGRHTWKRKRKKTEKQATGQLFCFTKLW